MSVRSNPFETMERMFDQMRRTGFTPEPFAASTHGSAFDATVSVEREDDGFVVVADLPGFEREEIELTYADGLLRIAGAHEEGDGGSYRSRSVEETVAIPADVDEEGIEASYKNGVLEIRLPLAEVEEERHHIDIR